MGLPLLALRRRYSQQAETVLLSTSLKQALGICWPSGVDLSVYWRRQLGGMTAAFYVHHLAFLEVCYQRRLCQQEPHTLE